MSSPGPVPIRLGVPYIPRQRWAGGYQYFASLATSLRAEVPAEITPVVLLPPGAPAEEREELERASGGSVFEDAAFGIPSGSRTLANLMRRTDPGAARGWGRAEVDVVIQVAAFHGWRPGPAVLAWIPDLQHRHLPEYFSRARWWRRELGFQAQLRAADWVLVSSQAARQDVERWYPWTHDRITVAPFVPAPPDLSDATSGVELRAKYRLPEEFIYMPNQLWGHKGHQVVAEALRLLGEAAPVVVSTGATKDHRDPGVHDRLLASIEAGGLGHKYRLLGMVPRRDVIGLLREAKALLNPSRFEGWSTTVEEAKMIGTPLLLSDIPVHREQAGGEAIFFGPNDDAALARVLARAMDESMVPGRADADSTSRRWLAGRNRFVTALSGAVSAALTHRARTTPEAPTG